ncbi:MAG: cadherin-like beta sandwich domain-containing protein [Bacilli bacterium]|nr:cadherin-like beta sandwich domain-containing protein [Bacilli bacterium]
MKKILLFVFLFFLTFLNTKADEVYLKNILIDGVSLKDFETLKTTYDLKYESTKESLNLAYDYDKNLYKGKGNTGEVKLNYGLNKLSFTLTSMDNEKTITYNLNITREDGRSNDNSLRSLTVASKKVNLTDSLEYEVLVDNSLKSVELTAVKNHEKAEFLNGYGERVGSNKITLSGEITKIEVKVKAENESIKTYVITIRKENYKSPDNTLKSLKINEINFKFSPNITEYNLNCDNSVDKININALTNYEKATIDYDRVVNLNVGLNEVNLLVTAEDGTTKTYKLNITRLEKEYLVKDIEITGVEFDFNPEVFDYEIETNLDTLDFKITLNKETVTSNILNNESLSNNSLVQIEIKEGEEVLIYNFKVIKEEIESDVTNQNNEDKNQENNFFKEYEMYIGIGVFFFGIFSMMVALLMMPKKSQIM